MMTMMLRVVLIVVSVITMTFMMRKIRQAKVQIEAAMFWVIMALILVVFAVVPGAADLCARLLGIYSTPNFLFLFMIFLLIVKAFGMTIQLSQLESKQRELIQKNGSGAEIPGRKRGRAGRTGSCVRNLRER